MYDCNLSFGSDGYCFATSNDLVLVLLLFHIFTLAISKRLCNFDLEFISLEAVFRIKSDLSFFWGLEKRTLKNYN